MKIIMLGCGGIGANVVRQLVPRNPAIDYVIADIRLEAAEAIAAQFGGNVTARQVDIHDPASIDALFTGASLVFNSVGPYYKHALPVIEAALRARIDYIDINDDHDVAETLFLDPTMDRLAREAGVRLIIGCGSTPGLTNVMTRLLADRLDRPRAVHLATVVPFVPALFSPAILDHMFHITTGDVVQYIDGEYRKMPVWGGRREFAYSAPFGTYPAFYIGHGETVTIPHFIKGLEQVTNRLGFFPEAGSEVWRSLAQLGFGSHEEVPGTGVSPLQFLGHYIATEEGSARLAVPLGGEPWGASSRVEVEGERGGDTVTSVLEFQQFLPGSETETAEGGDPTPTCARLAIQAWLDGEVSGEGLLAPEACLDPEKYVRAFARETGASFFHSEAVVKRDIYA